MEPAVVQICAVLLACVFIWSAVAKVIAFTDWRRTLFGYRLGALAPAASVLVPLVEAGTAVALVIAPVRAPAASTLALLAVFSAAVLRARALEGSKLPCGCFGRTKARDYRLMLARNASLALLAAAILLAGEGHRVLEDTGLPSTSEMVPAALTFIGLVGIALVAASVSRSFRKGR